MPTHETTPSARQLHEWGEPAAVVAEQLLEESGAAPWAVGVLTRTAAESASSGELAQARALLARALREMPARIDLDRVRTLIELGRVEAAAGMESSRARWETAADQLGSLEPADRMRALVDLGEATYAAGMVPEALEHFEGAWDLRNDGATGTGRLGEETNARMVAGLSTTSLLSGRRHPGVEGELRSVIDRTPRYPDLPTRALMASAAGEVALGVDLPAHVAHRLIDGALGEEPLPPTVLRPVIEPLAAALSLTGRPAAAVDLLDERLARAASSNDIVSHVSLLPLRAHAHLLADDLAAARDDALDALDLIERFPGATRLAEAPARYALAVALLELDDLDRAETAVGVADHRQRWGPTPMHGWFLDGLARVRAARHDHDGATAAWREAARSFTLVGRSAVICEWRDGLARSLLASGNTEAARRIAAEHLEVAESFGERRILAIAMSTTAAVESDHLCAAGVLADAISELEPGSAELTRCRLGLERGARLRRAGRRRSARDQLTASLSIASRLGAARLIRLIGEELAAAGGAGAESASPSRAHCLTPTERRTAELAAEGLGNVEIARRRAVSRKTVESQLSSIYRKLGISGRDGLDPGLLDPPDLPDPKGTGHS